MDVVIADSAAVLDRRALQQHTEALGARLMLAPVAAANATARHDAGKLSEVMAEVLELPSSDGGVRDAASRRGTGQGVC
jgi:hypothetical protein